MALNIPILIENIYVLLSGDRFFDTIDIVHYYHLINRYYNLCMNKKFLIIVVIFLVVIGLAIFNRKENTNDPIKIGFVSSLSGDASLWGEPLKNGFDFAVQEINNKGGIKGRLVEVISEDDLCEAKSGINAFSKLIDVHKVKIITGTVCSSVAMSVSQKTQNSDVLYIASGATDPDVVKQGDLIFRLWVSDSYEARAIADYAIDDLNLKSFGILYINDNPAGLSLSKNFTEAVELKGREITRIESTTSKENDLKTSLTKLKAPNPDGMYLMLMPDQMPSAINQLRDLGYEGVILGYAPTMYAEGVQENIKNTKDIYYALPVTEQTTDFWEEYELVNGVEADLLTSLGYDSMKIIESGLIQCGEDNGCIKDYFLTFKGYMTTRGLITFDENGDLTDVNFEIKSLSE